MSTIRLHTPHHLSIGQDFPLSEDMVHHMRVRRISVGGPCVLFNDKDGAFQCIRKDHDMVHIQAQITAPWISPPLRLLAPLIRPKNFTWMLTKATEIGVTDIHPVVTEHAQVRTINHERFLDVCREAVEQCERFTLPIIHPPCSLEHYIAHTTTPLAVALERQHACSWSQLPLSLNTLLVGPEGGFSEKERVLFERSSLCHRVTLGPAILRAETAAICGLTLLANHKAQ